MFNHIDFIEQHLKEPIKKQGILKVGINLNDYLSFNDANIYAENYAKKFTRKYTNDKARQSKSSKDSVLGKLGMVVPSTQMEAQIRLPRGEAQACEICSSM